MARYVARMLSGAICIPLIAHATMLYTGQLPAIHAAVARNDTAFVAQWVRQGRDVDEEYDDNRFCIHGCSSYVRKVTPLMVAADRGNLAMVKMLVEAGADVNRESTFPPSGIPNMGPLPPVAVFDYAVGSGNPELVEYLAHDPRLTRPPPHLARNFKQALAEACKEHLVQEGQFKIVEFLLATFGPKDAAGDLWMASASEKCIPIAQRLLDAGVKPDVIAMSNAARHGVTELVRLYVSMGVPVNEKGKGHTMIAVSFSLPLIEAARFHHVETLRVLLDAGADPNLADPFNPIVSTALASAALPGPAGDWRPKMEECPNEVEAIQLLLDRGARNGLAAAVGILDARPPGVCTSAKRAVLSGVSPDGTRSSATPNRLSN